MRNASRHVALFCGAPPYAPLLPTLVGQQWGQVLVRPGPHAQRRRPEHVRQLSPLDQTPPATSLRSLSRISWLVECVHLISVPPSASRDVQGPGPDPGRRHSPWRCSHFGQVGKGHHAEKSKTPNAQQFREHRVDFCTEGGSFGTPSCRQLQLHTRVFREKSP